MRSSHADSFNHDAEAAGYDADVEDESNPIRAGYARTLDWVAERSAIRPGDDVIDLGTGTGNLAARLPTCRRLVGVDVSGEMLALARAKLGDGAELVQSDLLEVLDGPGTYDVVVSTYAVHHLTSDEKGELLARARARLRPGGRLVVGDLMVASASAVAKLRARLRHEDVDAFFAEEFAWEVDETVRVLDRDGFRGIAVEQLSDLSWGAAALVP